MARKVDIQSPSMIFAKRLSKQLRIRIGRAERATSIRDMPALLLTETKCFLQFMPFLPIPASICDTHRKELITPPIELATL